ncbi:ArnT family glycosyltransferase [Roseibacillus ishigakijimensis]|uniref:Glycosyltransferase family 39 protein n=1 Tax=Roseibacillus ishigakijimensis TaxID=454146 RepID=A0A934RW96_9BACT|nr:glycosyltransferase family 39 protein [Roseibacillus ishigakijimensis]MBK1835596.1 glycosyltransferase family 39 protein [Roseibacillus ishigakijimensis]
MNPNGASNLGSIALRAVFFIVLIVMAILHVTVLFRGLNTPEGMEQAAIAREVSRGKGLVTKVLRPAAINQNQIATSGEGTLADAAENTYHAPLQPLLLGAIFRAQGAGDFEAWRLEKGQYVYQLDRIVAGFAIVCLVLAIGVTYLLVCRIFDSRIAATVALLMLFCELFWKISMSGLPQMLMLLLFTSGCYFAYRALENTAEERNTIVHAILAAVFFALLCLSHWIAVWLVIGYAVAAALFIKPRGVAGIIALVALIAAAAMPVIHNIQITGNPGGAASLVLYEGLFGSEEYAMRSLETLPLKLRNLTLQILRLTVAQFNDLYLYFGSILAAPLFFVALFHPFKRASISEFRWFLLLMWIFASFGMALFGLKGGDMSPNQIHLLFAPLMGAYGVAMLSVLWNRLSISKNVPLLRQAHLVLIVVISASPFLLRMPFDVLAIFNQGEIVSPNYPPYAPSTLDENLADYGEKDEIIVSDQPWAVAWYADRRSVWLPIKMSHLEEIEDMAEEEETPVTGVLISPLSSGIPPLTEALAYNRTWQSLVLDPWAAQVVADGTPRRPRLISSYDEEMDGFHSRYPGLSIILFRRAPMIFYSSRPTGS